MLTELLLAAGSLFAIKKVKNLSDKQSEADAEAQKKAEEENRQNSWNGFNKKLTADDFSRLAHKSKKKFKRIKYIETKDSYVIGTFVSQSGINEYEFKIDYNDYGAITGKYWVINRGNYDSDIPISFANEMKSLIKQFNEISNSYFDNAANYEINFPHNTDNRQNQEKTCSSYLIHFCSNCGTNKIHPQDNYCPVCGHKL